MLRKAVSVVAGFGLASFVYGGELLINGGMEKTSLVKGKMMAVGFHSGFYGGSKGSLSIDDQIVHAGKNSLRLEKDNKSGWQQAVAYAKFSKPLAGETKIEVSAWLYGQKITRGALVFFAGTSKKPQSLWKSFATFTGSFGWKKYSAIFSLSPGTIRAALSIRLQRGPGMIWMDDCSMRLLAPAASGPDNGQLLKNPKMTGPFTDGLPEGWKRHMIHGYETVAEYAAAESPDGKPAIDMIWKNGGGKFGVQAETFKALSGACEFSAKVKTGGGSRAVLSVSAYNRNDTLLERCESSQVAAPNWKNLSLKFVLPPGTARTEITCVNMGQGAVSVSDASLRRIPASSIKSFPLDALCMPVETMKTAVGKAEFNSFASRPVPLVFHFKGKSGVKDAALIVEAPVELRFVEAYNTHTNLKLKQEIPEEEKIVINGKPYVRYTFKKMELLRILQTGYGWERKLAMAFVPRKGDAGKSYMVYWYLTGNGKKSNTRYFTFNVLPDMKPTPNPANFPFMVWNQFDTNFNNPELFSKIAENYREAGISYRKRSGEKTIRRHDDILEKTGWKMFTTHPDFLELRFINGKELIRQLGGKLEYCVKSDGKVNKHVLCPGYFSADPEFRKYLCKFISDKLDKYGVKDGEVTILDSEPWDPGNWCLCKRCRRDFAGYAKLKKTPAASEIKKNYAEQWRDFRCRVHAAVIRSCAEAIRKARPGAIVGDYDYAIHFDDPDYRNYYYSVAKDPVLNEKYIDLHQSSYYHYLDKVALELIELNIKNLKKEYHVVAALERPGTYLSAREVLSPARMRLMLLGAAVGGAKGFGLYPGCHIDGKHLLALDRAMAEVAACEKFFAEGTPANTVLKAQALPVFRKEISVNGKTLVVERPDWKPYFASRSFLLKDKKLLVLLNYHPEKDAFANVSAGLPNGKYMIFDVVTGKKVLPDRRKQYFSADDLKKGFIAKVEHTGAALYVIAPYSADAFGAQAMYSSDWAKEFNKIKSTVGGNAFRPVKRNSMSISEDDVDVDGSVDICLKTPAQQVWISAERGGILSGWRVGEANFCYVDKNVKPAKRSMLWDYFWEPKSMRDIAAAVPCRIVDAKISKNAASLVLCKKLKKQKLNIIKTITVCRDNPSIDVKIEIVNNDKAGKKLSYWSHNLPCIGAPETTQSNLDMLIPTAKTLKIISGPKASEMIPDATGKLGAYAKKEHDGMIVEVNRAQLLKAYVWRGSGQTLEWIYKPVEIKPGGTWRTAFLMTAYTGINEKVFRKKL